MTEPQTETETDPRAERLAAKLRAAGFTATTAAAAVILAAADAARVTDQT
ncbi:hypothetical protein [Streptomyces bohaiensis]